MNEAEKAFAILRADPVLHIEELQGVASLQEYQKDICRAVVNHERVAIAACHNAGKSFIMAKLVLWFASVHRGAKVITTAPTNLQVKKILWAEIRAGHANSKVPLGGQLNLNEWKLDDGWFALGFSPQKSPGSGEGQGTNSSFQGHHSEHVMIIFDESTGIPSTLWTQAEGMLTSGHVRFVAIGNPTSRQCDFYKCFSNPAWHKIYLSCFNSPNLKANGIVDIQTLHAELDLLRSLSESDQQKRLASYKVVQSVLLSTSWVMNSALTWGIDHPLFQSKVLGIFPEEDDHVLVPLGTVEMAQRRTSIEAHSGHASSVRSIGVDVARFGSDKTVITEIDGAVVQPAKVLTKLDTMMITGEIVNLLLNSPRRDREIIEIDATGIGSGVVDALRERVSQRILPSHIQVRERHFGESATSDENKTKYANFKAEIFVKLSESIKADLTLPNESIYLEELPSIRYSFDSKGRYVIESKDDYKKRTGRSSPDHADSLALANFGRTSNNIGEFSDDFLHAMQENNSIAGSIGDTNSW